MLKCFQASPSEGCSITLSTTSYDWCHVMCSTVIGDMNNLGVIGKYLSFLCSIKFFPCQSWVYNENVHMFYTRLTLYFQGNITCRSFDTC
jgi:hypothetical protein